MARNRLIVAGVLLVALGVIAAWKLSQSKDLGEGEELVPTELPDVDKAEIDELVVDSPDKADVRLKKRDETWFVVEPMQARADSSAADTALDKLAELEVTGVAASREQNHDRLEVTDDKGVHVTALAGGEEKLHLIVGTYRSGNTMVRLPGETQVVSVRGSMRFAFDKELKDWRHRLVAEVKRDDIEAIEFENPSGLFRFEKDGDSWKIAQGSKPIPDFDAKRLDTLVSSVANLRAADFAAGDVTAEDAGFEEDGAARVTYRVGGESPQEITLRIGSASPNKDEHKYLQREGDDTLYLVSDYMARRLSPDVRKLSENQAPTAAARPPGSPQAPPGARPIAPPGATPRPGAPRPPPSAPH